MSSSFWKGMMAGMVMGIGVVSMLNPMDQKDMRQAKRRANRVIRAVGDMADNVSHWMH